MRNINRHHWLCNSSFTHCCSGQHKVRMGTRVRNMPASNRDVVAPRTIVRAKALFVRTER